eukprot:s809_g7.t1
MLRTLTVLWWTASCQEFNITQDPSCLLQIQPGRYGEASGSPTCASSASWTQQLFVEPRPALAFCRSNQGATGKLPAAASVSAIWGPFDRGSAERQLRLDVFYPNTPSSKHSSRLRPHLRSGRLGVAVECQPHSSGTAKHYHKLGAGWAQRCEHRHLVPSAAVSVGCLQLCLRRDVLGVNLETFPEGKNCDDTFGGCLKLGGNLLLFRPQAVAPDFEFQTFQWQGTSWFLIPSANLTSPETALTPSFAVDGQHLVVFTATIASGPVRTIPVLSVYEWTGNSWPEPVNFTNFTSLVSQPIQLPVAFSKHLLVQSREYLQKTHRSGTICSFTNKVAARGRRQVYGQEVGETSPQGNFIDGADISSSGKAILTGVSRNVRRVFLFERDADGIWGPTQTLVFNETATADDGAVGIGDTAAVVTYFPTESGFDYWLQLHCTDNSDAFLQVLVLPALPTCTPCTLPKVVCCSPLVALAVQAMQAGVESLPRSESFEGFPCSWCMRACVRACVRTFLIGWRVLDVGSRGKVEENRV